MSALSLHIDCTESMIRCAVLAVPIHKLSPGRLLKCEICGNKREGMSAQNMRVGMCVYMLGCQGSYLLI